MPSKKSLERVECRSELFRRDGSHYCHLPREHEGDCEYFYTRKQLYEAIREAALREAEWWQRQIESRRHGMRFFKQEDGQKGADRIEAEHVAQLREGKP